MMMDTQQASSSTAWPDRSMPTLPRTIEEATRRYLHHYTKNFVGPYHELLRLKGLTQAFILKLRKVAPKFYDEKLPQFVNQACSTLLTYDTSTREGSNEFNKCHCAFLKILEDFRQSQPAGEISFSNERLRLIERKKLTDRYLDLKAKIEKLEAAEIDSEELGEDEFENAYDKLFRDLDMYKAELKRVSIEIAYIDGYQVEEEPNFELKIPPRSILNCLTKEQLDNLEKQMFELIKANKNKRTAMYVDKSIIDSMIEKLNIDPTQFKKEQLKDLTKDALDAYKSYFRDIDCKNREKFYDELVTRPSLLPREGIIIKNPDDVPEDVRIKLEQNNRQCKREIEDLLETYSKRPCADDHTGDTLEPSDDEEDDTLKIIETVRLKGIKFERVKEEPRDDCEEIVSGDEMEVDGRLAEAVVDNQDITYASTSRQVVNDEEEFEQVQSQPVKTEMSGGSDGVSNSHDDDDSGADDDDIEFLGTVEPTDKIKTLDLIE
jgi:hypothetical protein